MADRIVTLHHMPASGGTVISKAFAAMSAVVLLSEVHPDRTLWGGHNPLVQIVWGYPSLLGPKDVATLDRLFLDEISFVHDVASRSGKHLIVRDHAFVDFFLTSRRRSRLIDVLRQRWDVQPMLTVRDPVDVWISCSLQGWMGDITPDEFCLRYLAMVSHFQSAPCFRYEDFAEAPVQTMKAACEALDLPFSEDFLERLSMITHMTGDSGRSSNTIGLRPRQWGKLQASAVDSFLRSDSYLKLTHRLGYPHIGDTDDLQSLLQGRSAQSDGD